MLPEVIVYWMVGFDASHPKGTLLAQFNSMPECTDMLRNPQVVDYAQKNGIRLECVKDKK